MDKKELITETIKKIAGFMQVEYSLDIQEEVGEAKTAVASIQVPGNANSVIGKNGQNLQALEQIVRLIVWKKTGEKTPISVDINEYRKTKAVQAIEAAKLAVSRVRNTQRAEALFPMSAYERRMVHMELAAYSDIATESIGEDPQRRIVIKPFQI